MGDGLHIWATGLADPAAAGHGCAAVPARASDQWACACLHRKGMEFAAAAEVQTTASAVSTPTAPACATTHHLSRSSHQHHQQHHRSCGCMPSGGPFRPSQRQPLVLHCMRGHLAVPPTTQSITASTTTRPLLPPLLPPPPAPTQLSHHRALGHCGWCCIACAVTPQPGLFSRELHGSHPLYHCRRHHSTQ